MRSKSNVRPEPVSFERIDNARFRVRFAENVTEDPNGAPDGVCFSYDEYTAVYRYREGILDEITADPLPWLALAKNA